MRLWLDDVRPAPVGWTWAKTNDEAKQILSEHDVTHCSLDHDLGLHAVDAINDFEEIMDRIDTGEIDVTSETGFDLVVWMIEHNRVPEHITIHSWNSHGAHRMAMRFVDAGYECTLAPFRP